MLAELFTPKPKLQTSGLENPADWFVQYVGGGATDAGISVTGDSALKSGNVLQAITVIAGDVGQLPFSLFDGQREVLRHPARRAIAIEPHTLILPSTFREVLTHWALLWGNGCALILRDPIRLFPLLPNRITPLVNYDPQGPELFLEYQPETDKRFTIPYENVLHIRGLGHPLWGLTIFQLLGNTFGLDQAFEKHAARTFGNGARPGGWISSPKPIDPKKAAEIRRQWKDVHAGLENTNEPGVLGGGMEWHEAQLSMVDAQWADGTKLTRQKVASIFNLPNFKLGDMENALRANVSELNRIYLNQCLGRWLNKWVEECTRKLTSMQPSLRWKFNLQALLRASFRERMEGYGKGREWGVLTLDQIAAWEDWEPVGGDLGEQRLRPANMVPLEVGVTPVDGSSSQTFDQRLNEQITLRLERIANWERHRVPEACTPNSRHRTALGRIEHTYRALRTFAENELSSVVAIQNTTKPPIDLGANLERFERARMDAILRIAGENAPDTFPAAVEEFVRGRRDYDMIISV